MKSHKHSDGLDYDGLSCADGECGGDQKAAEIAQIIDGEATSLWTPDNKELKAWKEVSAQATDSGKPQYIVVDSHVYRLVDTGITARELIDAYHAAQRETPTPPTETETTLDLLTASAEEIDTVLRKCRGWRLDFNLTEGK